MMTVTGGTVAMAEATAAANWAITRWSWGLDGWIVLVGALCAASAALLGNFLVLRRMSMLGDAVTHAVLPGIAAAFFMSGSRDSFAIFLGAILVGVLTAVFTEWIRRVGKVDEGASMGVVFTSLFALGLVMISQIAEHVDLDPDCVLYGALDMTTLNSVRLGGKLIPRAAITLSIVFVLNLTFVVLFFKELKISSFDPGLSTTMGFSSRIMHYALMVFVSITAVASFESVGSILVVAMFVVPAAAAYMLTDRLGVMIGLSVLIAMASSLLGHTMAIELPSYFGFSSTTSSGMMAVAAGLMFFAAALLSPKHGVLIKWLRRHRLSWSILCDDIVATLYRAQERADRIPTFDELCERLLAQPRSLSLAAWWLRRRGELASGSLELTESGHHHGRQLVRSHRLWEQYLVDHAGTDAELIHGNAERFEHFTDRPLRDQLDRVTDTPTIDPHGTPIPSEEDR